MAAPGVPAAAGPLPVPAEPAQVERAATGPRALARTAVVVAAAAPAMARAVLAQTAVAGAGGAGGVTGAVGTAGAVGAVNLGGGGGGGGGGGASGSSAASLPGGALTGVVGGAGGAGGASSGTGNGGGGGGGGSGGFGATVTGATANTNSVTIIGGMGGAGGAGGATTGIGGDGGAGGDGGVGIFFSVPGASLTNSDGSIQGGAGGAAGALGAGTVANGTAGAGGAGGAGVVGSGLTIINSGTIAGGLASGAVTRANAITFTGGVNSLTLQSGFSISGNVVAVFGGTDTFALGGATNSAFDTTQIGVQYQNFTVFNKTGTSVWTLTGTPGQATPWLISDGTLLAGAATNVFGATSAITVNSPGILDLGGFNQTIGSLAGSGTVTNSVAASATLTTGDATSTVFSGVIQDGAGQTALTKEGIGTFTLSGTNIYTGATTINGGTLALTGAGSIANSSGVNVANAAGIFDITGTTTGASITTLSGVAGSSVMLGDKTLTLSNASTTYSGVISGTGGALSLSAGTQTLAGTNIYTGATTINGGTLALTGAGSIANSSGVNVANAAGIFDITGTTTGASITTLSGVAGSSVMLGDKTLTLSNASTTYNGVISGTNGALSLSAGTQTLAGTNIYTGATTINGGTLQVLGSIANSSLTTVNSGVLFGTGTVGNTSIASGGTFQPGSGTPGSSMTVTGNLGFASGSFYAVSLNPATSSFANVSGTATLGGATVKASYAAGSYISKQYTILTAGSVNGTFGSLVNTNLPANFTAVLSYDAAHAYLNFSLNFVPPPPGPNFSSPLNINQQNVANGLINSFNVNGGIPIIFGALTPGGLTQISGEVGASFAQVAFQAGTAFLNLMLNPSFDGHFATDGFGPIGYADEAQPAAAKTFAAFDRKQSSSFRLSLRYLGIGIWWQRQYQWRQHDRLPQHHQSNFRLRQRSRLSRDTGHTRRLRTRRRRHPLGPRPGLGEWTLRHVPGRGIWQDPLGRSLSRRCPRLFLP